VAKPPAEKLAAASWQQRVRALNRHGSARYDERTASMLGMPASCCRTATGATRAACAPRPGGTRGRSGGWIGERQPSSRPSASPAHPRRSSPVSASVPHKAPGYLRPVTRNTWPS
jgi:hypothetical protein